MIRMIDIFGTVQIFLYQLVKKCIRKALRLMIKEFLKKATTKIIRHNELKNASKYI